MGESTEPPDSAASDELIRKMKALLVENLMLTMAPDDIGDTQPLFGPESLGLDSVDALQLVVALEKGFGLRIPDAGAAREVLQNVSTMAAAVRRGSV
ncbi:MAG: acyl carrier protein [Verrucomicrobiae bacterium]|nr:acyl carrier protein [Verrucomicrobiae bacterium]